MALHLQKEINRLKTHLLALGTVVEEAVRDAMMALENRDDRLAQKVMENDYIIDQKEVDLEEECLKILALYQPVANDLRFVVAILKINNDLERIGDLAGSIAERAKALAFVDKVNINFDFHKMAEMAKTMLRQSLDALVNMDADLAAEVCRSDDDVDTMHRNIYSIIKELIPQNLDRIEVYIQFIVVSRALERIADHATNIAEDVMYMIQGQIVRHLPQKKGPKVS